MLITALPASFRKSGDSALSTGRGSLIGSCLQKSFLRGSRLGADACAWGGGGTSPGPRPHGACRPLGFLSLFSSPFFFVCLSSFLSPLPSRCICYLRLPVFFKTSCSLSLPFIPSSFLLFPSSFNFLLPFFSLFPSLPPSLLLFLPSFLLFYLFCLFPCFLPPQ